MIFDIFLTIFLVLLNSFFVAAEFAIVKVRASQLELRIKSGNKIAVLSKHIVSHLDGYLAATQLGITLASLGLGWIGEPVVSKFIIKFFELLQLPISTDTAHTIALPIAFAFITVLHIVFGELAPKSLAIQRSETTVLFVTYPLQMFYWLFRPFIWLLNGIANFILKRLGITSSHTEVHSHEELQYLVQQGQKSGEIDEAEYKIIKNAFDFSEQTVRQIMVPRTKVFAIDVTTFSNITIDEMIEESYSRVPCYEKTLDNLVGVVYLRDILIEARKQKPIDLKQIIRPPYIVPESKNIGQLLNEFQTRHQQMALVVNEYGGTEGIVTMEDILEELVGEIQDEYDNETPFVEKTGDKTYQVLAATSVDNLNELLPHPLQKDEEYETLGGYLILKWGKIPHQRERIILDNYEMCVLKRTKSSIILVQMTDLLAPVNAVPAITAD